MFDTIPQRDRADLIRVAEAIRQAQVQEASIVRGYQGRVDLWELCLPGVNRRRLLSLVRRYADALGGAYRPPRYRRADRRAFNADARQAVWLPPTFTPHSWNSGDAGH